MEFFTKFGIVSTFLLDGFTTNKSRLVVTVIGCNNEVNTSVNTYNITDVRNITFFDIISYWYVKIIFTMFVYKLSRAELIDCVVEILRHTVSEIWQFNTAIKRIHRKTVLCKGIIPVPNKIVLWLFERRFYPLFLIFENSLISCNDRLRNRLSHL